MQRLINQPKRLLAFGENIAVSTRTSGYEGLKNFFDSFSQFSSRLLGAKINGAASGDFSCAIVASGAEASCRGHIIGQSPLGNNGVLDYRLLKPGHP